MLFNMLISSHYDGLSHNPSLNELRGFIDRYAIQSQNTRNQHRIHTFR